MLKKASLFINTLRYLEPAQVLRRGRFEFRKMLGKRVPTLPPPPSGLHWRDAIAPSFIPSRQILREKEVRIGWFDFVGRAETLGRPVDWTAADLPLLWRFELHSFRYLPTLEAKEALALCEEWVDGNPPGSGVGWRPYPTSLRIVNWCKSAARSRRILESLYQQAYFLGHRLEDHLGGNHLLENARALVFAGTYLAGVQESDSWLAKGLRLLRDQLPVQVLADGGHYERSPMYHRLMLELLLDVLAVLPSGHPEAPPLRETAQRMLGFATALSHPDGEIALFNDAAIGVAASLTDLRDHAERNQVSSSAQLEAFPESGYWVWRRGSLCLLADAGPVCPDSLPAHAHCDIFSFELSDGAHRIVVDSGTYDYEAGPMRTYLRSTAAHNTVGIDGVDQAECWSVFRVGRRFPPHGVTWNHDGTTWELRGSFSGYARLIGDHARHQRSIQCSGERIEIVDLVDIDGSHEVVSRLHLHPDCSVRIDGKRAFVEIGTLTWVADAEGGHLGQEEGWYCPHFGERRRNVVLSLTADRSRRPLRLAFLLQRSTQDQGSSQG